MYIADTYYQIDGSAFQNSNCVASVGTALADEASVGYYRPAASKLRTITGDTTGGLNFDEVIAAIKTATGGEVVLSRLFNAPVTTLDDLLNAPRVFGIGIDCSVTINTPFHTASYTGLHDIGGYAKRIHTWTDSAGVKHSQKQALIGDPGKGTSSNKLPKVWWPWSLLVKAALAATGGNGVHVWYTRDLEGVSRKAEIAGRARATASLTATDKGAITSGTTYSVASLLNGGSWTINGHTGHGWNKLASGIFVPGGYIH